MAQTSKQLEHLIDEEYIPSELERRRVVLYYLWVGLVLGLQKEMTNYERWHLKQALWWRVVFVIIVFATIPLLLFGHRWWFLQGVLLLIWIGVAVRLMRRALKWEIVVVKKNKKFVPFPWLEKIWWWILQLFEESDNENLELASEQEESNSSSDSNDADEK